LAGKTRETTQQIQSVIGTLKQGAADAVDIANLGIGEADNGVQQVIETQLALKGICEAVERISCMSQQMAVASENQSHTVEDISGQINTIAVTVENTAKNANVAAVRGRELESISQGLHALVERFNR
jgi:aerotaxis receptor